MNINHGRIIKIFVIILTISIIGFCTFNSLVKVYNTDDPLFAKKIALTTMLIVLTSIIAGGFVLYLLRDQERKQGGS